MCSIVAPHTFVHYPSFCFVIDITLVLFLYPFRRSRPTRVNRLWLLAACLRSRDRSQCPSHRFICTQYCPTRFTFLFCKRKIRLPSSVLVHQFYLRNYICYQHYFFIYHILPRLSVCLSSSHSIQYFFLNYKLLHFHVYTSLTPRNSFTSLRSHPHTHVLISSYIHSRPSSVHLTVQPHATVPCTHALPTVWITSNVGHITVTNFKSS